MQPQLYFFTSIAFSLIAWSIVATRYFWPKLRVLPRADALRPLLTLHSFRFLGLSFLVPGVVSPDLPPAFAHSAAYGDVIAATLALLSLLLLRSAAGVAVVWIFNLWGSADLLNSFGIQFHHHVQGDTPQAPSALEAPLLANGIGQLLQVAGEGFNVFSFDRQIPVGQYDGWHVAVCPAILF